MYASSRTLVSLSQNNHAPSIFSQIDSNGCPRYSLLVTVLISCLAFLGIFLGDGAVFTWLLTLTGTSGLLTWFSISFIHLRFRAAYIAQGKDLNDMTYKAPLFPFGNWIAIIIGSVIIIGQVFLLDIFQYFLISCYLC